MVEFVVALVQYIRVENRADCNVCVASRLLPCYGTPQLQADNLEDRDLESLSCECNKGGTHQNDAAWMSQNRSTLPSYCPIICAQFRLADSSRAIRISP